MIRTLRNLVASLLVRVSSAASWTASEIFGNSTGYNATDPRRPILAPRQPVNQTANQLLTASLPLLRSHSRFLERNNPTARAAVDGLVACVVGSGIGLEPDTGDATIDAKIREQWVAFIEDCSVDGRSLYDLQTLGFREVITAGEALWREVVLPDRARAGKVPLAILPLEAEWIDTTYGTTLVRNPDGTIDVNGIRVDAFGRPVHYRLRHPEYPSEQAEIIPAAQVIHPFEKRRALQARGEPWFAPVVEVLSQERDLVDAEIASAKNTSAMAMVITSDSQDGLDTDTNGTPADPAQSIRLGGVARLYPNEKVEAFSHTRPSQQIAPFRQMLRGDTAGALRIAQRFLDRDVSRANYSSMRSDNLDTERLLGPVREWYGHATAGRLYRDVLPYLALMAGVKTPRARYRLIPDGQPYVDPKKDAEASLVAIAGGLSTHEAEIGKKGGDRKQVWDQLAKEKAEAQAMGLDLVFSAVGTPAPVDGGAEPAPAAAAAAELPPERDGEYASQTPVVVNVTLPANVQPEAVRRSFKIHRDPKTGHMDRVDASDEASG